MRFDFERANNYEYVVKKGDTLYTIAKMYDVTVDQLLKANGLTSALIYPNQVLIIPLNTNGNIYFVEYVVKDNDSALLMERKLTIPIFVNGDILAKDGIIKILNSYSKNIIFDKNGRIYYFGNKHFNDFDNFIDCGGGLVFDKGEERTSVRVIKIKKDIGLDDYIYKEYDISLNYYTKEELKYFSSKIKYSNDVCVNPLFNPNINKKEINENRKLIRSLRNK